jgi:uncharacterized membrane protein
METRTPSDPAPDREDATIQRNLEIVADIEERALTARSLGEKIGDQVSRVIGSIPFVLFHVAWFALWVALNVGWVPGVRPFDPFPFGLLTLVVSLEAIFLSLFLLISQNRMTRQADKRSHLDLQINLLAEAESTKILRILDRIADRVGVAKEEEPSPDLEEPTDIVKLASQVEKRIPESS